MYYTGIDPFTRKPVHTAKNLRDRKLLTPAFVTGGLTTARP